MNGYMWLSWDCLYLTHDGEGTLACVNIKRKITLNNLELLIMIEPG